MCVDLIGWELHVPDDGSADEAVFDRDHMWKSFWIGDGDIGQLHVEILIDRVQSSADTQIIFELHDNVLSYE